MRLHSIGIQLGLVLLLHISAVAQEQNPVGVWSMQADAQGQVSPFTLTITKEGNVLKGKIASELYGGQDLADLKYENGALTYTRKLEFDGQSAVMTFKGKIEGDKVTGSYIFEGTEIPVTGSRKQPPTAPVK